MAVVSDRRFPPAQGDERGVLSGWLDWQRATVHRKSAGLSDVTAQQQLLDSSSLSVASVVSHLRWVEWHWFERSFLGREGETADSSNGWDVGDVPLDNLLHAYAEQCAHSRSIVEAHHLDELETYAPPNIEVVSLRWIIGHVIEETARHLGHLDLLREAADGVRGY